MADALKLIGKRNATEALSHIMKETGSIEQKKKRVGGRKASQIKAEDGDDLTDSDDSESDDLGTGDDGDKRERR